MAGYKHLFSQIQLRHKTLRNRVVFGAHTANMAKDGLPGDQHLGYYKERALGGVGMMVIEPMPVHKAAILTRGNFRPDDDAVIPHFRRITEAVQAEGTVILQQLYHVGQHSDADNAFFPGWSPSGLPSYHDSDGSHAMTAAEIEETIEGFVQSARRCFEAGFDGVEVWAAYHSMLDQFWTPWSNRRDDSWGGSLENRTRMSMEVIRRIRKLCGEDFIIGLAISYQPGVEVHLQEEALSEIIALHDATGMIDYVTVGYGSYFDFTKIIPNFTSEEKSTVDLTRALKSSVKQALITSEGHIRTPDNAEAVLSAGQADLVSIVRGQIADPHWVNKARDARPEDIRGCLSCNQMCWGRRYRDYWISCVVNPSVGREHEWGGDRFEPAMQPKSVLVVGGGPAGLEAARVAAERGHQVTLAEASDKLGGQYRLAGLQPRRAQITDLMDWFERQLTKLQVKIDYNSYMDANDVKAGDWDEVIVATGSLPPETGFQKALPHLETLPGIELGNVWSAEDVMGKAARLGERVIVLDQGGNWRGGGTAWHLAEAGHKVTIVTPDAMVGFELQRTATDFSLRQRLASLGAVFITESAILEWREDGAIVKSLLTGAGSFIEADSLVMATTNMAEDSLSRDLNAANVNHHLIGDASAARQAPYAIYEGRKVGREV
ncbi:FAD-dependent oxidoreductase [Alphaproteobacteria bacterium]|nr:FAD-dependent oxidoreductase [Alphaproteobacteria bacterium]